MASLVTLGTLKTRCRQQADMEFSTFVSDSELVTYINDSAKDLYDMLIQSGEYYKISSSTINLVANQDTYTLPAAFYKMLGVDLSQSGQPITLKKFEFAERNKYSYYPYYNTRGLASLQYMVQGDSIKFVPMPNSADVITIWYAPVLADMVNDSDTFDVINGFDNYIIADVCIKMLTKEESDIQPFLLMKRDAEMKIQKMKLNRDMGGQYKVSDVVSDQYFGKFNGGN